MGATHQLQPVRYFNPCPCTSGVQVYRAVDSDVTRQLLFYTMIYSLNKLLESAYEKFGNRTYYRMSDIVAMEQMPDDAIVFRFDVERDLEHHLDVATLLAKANIPSSMYFHSRKACYDPDTLHRIEDLGHEVGFHHECLDRCSGDYERAKDLFKREVDIFRRDGFNLRTVCSHGEAGLPKHGYKSNWCLFERYPDLLEECGIKIEMYQWLREKSPLYASDTFTSYNKFWNTIKQASTVSQGLMVLVHVHRWHSSPIPSAMEVARDLIRQFKNRTIRQRTYQLAYPDEQTP